MACRGSVKGTRSHYAWGEKEGVEIKLQDRGRSYIARYALGEVGGQPLYRKTTAGGGCQQNYRISHEKETSY